MVPAIILGLGMSAVTMRMTRTMMLEVMRQDYIRTARAKGLGERLVIVRHSAQRPDTRGDPDRPASAAAYRRRGDTGADFRGAGHGAAAPVAFSSATTRSCRASSWS